MGEVVITGLVIAILTGFVVWLVRYIREGRRIDRILREFPYRIDPTSPTAAEISCDPRIPLDVRTHAAKLGKRIVAGESPPRDTSALWYSGPMLEDVEPAVPYDGPIKALMSPYEAMVPVRRYANGGPAKGGVVWFNEYAQMPSPRAIETRRDPITGEILNPTPTGCQHPNPEPVVLTTDEVVAGVCPDCLQPLPPSSVGSEWKP